MNEERNDAKCLESLQRRLDEVKAANENEERQEEFQENISAISRTIRYRIGLSKKEPQDGFILLADPETKKIISGR